MLEDNAVICFPTTVRWKTLPNFKPNALKTNL